MDRSCHSFERFLEGTLGDGGQKDELQRAFGSLLTKSGSTLATLDSNGPFDQPGEDAGGFFPERRE